MERGIGTSEVTGDLSSRLYIYFCTILDVFSSGRQLFGLPYSAFSIAEDGDYLEEIFLYCPFLLFSPFVLVQVLSSTFDPPACLYAIGRSTRRL